MKNTLLAIVLTGLISLSAGAQERFSSIVFNNNIQAAKIPAHNLGHPVNRSSLKNLNRTTSGSGGYWYDYNDSILTSTDSLGNGLASLGMWPDTAALFGISGDTVYTGYSVPAYGYTYNTSMGVLFNPMDSAWVPYGSFIPPTSGYTIDSVMVVGIYGRPNGATYIDSLKLTFVYGDGQTTSNLTYDFVEGASAASLLASYGLAASDSIWFIDMYWDTIQNAATHAPGVSIAPVTYTFPLGPGDTSVANLFTRSFPVNITVPAGNFTGMSVSFISGATSFPAFPATDTVQYTDGSFKYGDFQPVVSINPDTSVWLYFPESDFTHHPSVTDNFTTGYFKIEGATDRVWSPIYIPSFTFNTSASGPYNYSENPYVLFHAYSPFTTQTPVVTKQACEINAYPNPAVNEVTITFNLPASAEVSVSLTNMVGQVVDRQQIGKVSNGGVVVNTSALPSGVYFYTVTANGQRSTVRVVVAH